MDIKEQDITKAYKAIVQVTNCGLFSDELIEEMNKEILAMVGDENLHMASLSSAYQDGNDFEFYF